MGRNRREEEMEIERVGRVEIDRETDPYREFRCGGSGTETGGQMWGQETDGVRGPHRPKEQRRRRYAQGAQYRKSRRTKWETGGKADEEMGEMETGYGAGEWGELKEGPEDEEEKKHESSSEG